MAMVEDVGRGERRKGGVLTLILPVRYSPAVLVRLLRVIAAVYYTSPGGCARLIRTGL
ncbi:unnamed protein product [Tuber melanosporum]|uniref:(Perigord truffle) hypothetical protein n=1 Tax=Tuber melanosporum (strain Mel28) TaxID=656061 RepID=D5GKP6_TUBMM|nr:uncharacterized protein GSTUM_00009687001 [Tuber melanosporum]CAZ85089.1 unnamed protein product [Tuber melanosporum]